MSITKYKKILGIFICLIYLFYSVVPYIEIKSEASTALDSYIPSISIGEQLGTGYYITSIGNFLSHVLDASVEVVTKNLGYIWNRIVDSGYCPGNDNHRHNFIYGLTSTSLVNDMEQPREGYYCYCEYCGQMAGDLIQEYVRTANIDAEGKARIYPVACQNGYTSNGANIDTIVWDGDIYPYGTDYKYLNHGINLNVLFSYGLWELQSFSSLSNKWSPTAFIYNVDNYEFTSYSGEVWTYRTERTEGDSSTVVNEYNPPMNNNNIRIINDKYCMIYVNIGNIPKNLNFKVFYSGNYLNNMVLTLKEESLEENYNYQNIYAPIAYVNNGNLIYGGYGNSIVDSENMIYRNPKTGEEYDIENMEYDYSTNTWTLDISDFLNGVTVAWGNDGLTVNEDGSLQKYFYVTNTLTPINPIVNPNGGTTSGEINLDGTINLTVNQVSSNTNAYITTYEDIPQGLRGLRETLATMFVELPEMTGEFTDFMQTGFSYIPDEVMTLVVFGVSVAVFVGIFKLFWR